MSIIVFSLFFSWLLAFPFEGQVLYAITDRFNIDAHTLIFSSILAHFVGLFACGFIIKTMKQAKYLMIFSIALCMVGSVPFFFPPSIIWNISLLLTSLVAGDSVAAWSYYYKHYTPPNERIKTAADVLIYSNILMIITNMIAIHMSPYIGLAFSILILGVALFFQIKLPDSVEQDVKNKSEELKKLIVSPIKPLAFLCFFIVVITINSGLMYQVINPAFEQHQWLVSWYWAVPYIVALCIMKNLPEKVNRNYILYVAIAMIGFAFISFMMLDRSVLSYFVVNTLMLGACGIYDLFWWSILGEMLDFHNNPAKILGIGLSANVLGVLVGGVLGNIIVTMGVKYGTSILALVVVFFTLIILPLLHKHLSILLKNHVFLTTLYEMVPTKQNETIDNFIMMGKLTEREREIAELLLKGRTYKMIANELYLSENTVKTHIKNIYSKFNVQSKSELINLLMEKEHFMD